VLELPEMRIATLSPHSDEQIKPVTAFGPGGSVLATGRYRAVEAQQGNAERFCERLVEFLERRL
jgi:hypothetical protein